MQKWQNDLGWDQAAVPLRASGTGWWWGFCRCGSVWGRGRWSSMGCCTERSLNHRPPGHGNRSPCIRLSLPGGGPRCSEQPEECPRKELGFRWESLKINLLHRHGVLGTRGKATETGLQTRFSFVWATLKWISLPQLIGYSTNYRLYI